MKSATIVKLSSHHILYLFFGFYFEYLGRLSNSNRAHNVRLSAQSKFWKDISGAVSYFGDNMADVVCLPDYVPFVS